MKDTPKVEFAFCETSTAGSLTPWHIRKLTNKGLKLGGGADTEALCGRKVCWDLETKIDSTQLEYRCCIKCVVKYNNTAKTT